MLGVTRVELIIGVIREGREVIRMDAAGAAAEG